MTTRTLKSRVLAAFTPDPIPEAPHTPLIRSSTPSGALPRNTATEFPNLVHISTYTQTGDLPAVKITAQILEQAIDELDNDPTAGLGAFTKRQLLVDKLLRIFNAAEPSEVAALNKTAAPLLGEARRVAARQPTAFAKRQAAGPDTAADAEAPALTF
jgi:hypothetical protein